MQEIFLLIKKKKSFFYRTFYVQVLHEWLQTLEKMLIKITI